MPTIIHQEEEKKQVYSLIINETHTDEAGKLSLCTLIDQITMLHDQELIRITGGLDYNRISNYSYRFNVLGNAALHDIIHFSTSISCITPSLFKIEIHVTKRRRGKSGILAYAMFTYVTEPA